MQVGNMGGMAMQEAMIAKMGTLIDANINPAVGAMNPMMIPTAVPQRGLPDGMDQGANDFGVYEYTLNVGNPGMDYMGVM